jgi:DNA-binding NarL/FixJ family response regulator
VEPVRLAVVDDHPVVAAALAAGAATGPSAGTQRPIQLVGTARTVREAEALLRGEGPDAPDVVLCDSPLPMGSHLAG